MYDDEHPGLGALPHDDEALFILRMIGIGNDQSPIIKEHGFRFLKRDAMFPRIGFRLF